MRTKQFKKDKIWGTGKQATFGLGCFLIFTAGFGLWNEGLAVLGVALKIGGVGAVLAVIGALIPPKDQYTQR
ncbi:hypothetical protein [Sedimentitalea nanhaiensis]|uniref:Uncharacterized protein n=1 Tax=Sedimentitalea nanhaiensis TaxID=999627 RepID=A0A1I7E3X3_9RHOB|nr:hypothetical protein [Sedimentitalea nanhaiensis]SFU18617.1 hypothetical protein SAMN05216236_14321 [Sedimentitalea nanhaiensis]